MDAPRWGLACPGIANDQATWWTLRVEQVQANLSSPAVLGKVGIIANPKPTSPAWQDATFYGWDLATTSRVVRGVEVDPKMDR